MDNEVKELLEKRRLALTDEFNTLKGIEQNLSQQLKDSQIKQCQLQGAYEEIVRLLKQEPKKEEPA